MSDLQTLWPIPPELDHMEPQFRLGYRQAREEAIVIIERQRARIAQLEDDLLEAQTEAGGLRVQLEDLT